MKKSKLSERYKKRVISIFGDEGKVWLDSLPQLISACEAKFNLVVGRAFKHQSLNFTASATQVSGGEVVIKLCFPIDEFSYEVNALEFMRGDGIVNLIDKDSSCGLLLLEQLMPGEMLSIVNDDTEAMKIASDVMRKIWKPIMGGHTFKTTEQWFYRLNQPVALPVDFPVSFLDKAKNIAMDLHQSMDEVVLLHGDLHHFNILSASRQPWLAIDPKGVVGEREYEVGALLRNPIPEISSVMNTKHILSERVEVLSDLLGFDPKRVAAWGFAQAVLAAVWCIDMKSSDWRIFLKCAGVLYEI